MSNYFEIRRKRKRLVPYQRPEPPKLERALLVDGDRRQAESAAWLQQYHQKKEALRGKGKDQHPLEARLGDPASKRGDEGEQ